jgi:hypothetical protein
MAASLDGPAAEGKNWKINLVFTDLNLSYVLWIENAVLHHKQAPAARDANATLVLTKPVFVSIITGTADLGNTLLNDKLKVSGWRSLIMTLSIASRINRTMRTQHRAQDTLGTTLSCRRVTGTFNPGTDFCSRPAHCAPDDYSDRSNIRSDVECPS